MQVVLLLLQVIQGHARIRPFIYVHICFDRFDTIHSTIAKSIRYSTIVKSIRL